MNVYLEIPPMKKFKFEFDSSKYSYEKSLRDSGYTDFKLKFNKTSNNYTKRKCGLYKYWKKIPPTITSSLPPSNRLRKIFNNNTVKVS